MTEANLTEAKLHDATLTAAQLEGANLTRALLRGANLAGADLTRANLTEANLAQGTLTGAELVETVLYDADLTSADLSGANLTRADLTRATLSGTVLIDGNLTEATLERATMVETVLDGSTMSGCRVYGVAAWGLDLTKVEDQGNLVITPAGEAAITVDNLEVAQFIYLMLHNRKIRDVIDTVTGKGVLILGRFTDERKAVLDGIKERLRNLNFVPMVFDWDKSSGRDLTETVQLLANMSRFVVADVTDAKSIPQELLSIVPHLPSVPIRPIILAGQREYAMFEHFAPYPWMLPLFEYNDRTHLLENIEEGILSPVMEWEAGSKKKDDLEEQLRARDEEIERLRAALDARESEG